MSQSAAPAPPQAHNGLGTAGFVLGLLAVIFGWIPILGTISFPLGILGLVFGLLGFLRARKGRATNRGLSLAGAILGVIGLIFAIISTSATSAAVNSANQSITQLDPSVSDHTKATGWGQPYTWPDGLAVQVTKPQPFNPSPSAVTPPDMQRAVSMNITVTNNRPQPYQFNWAIFGPTATVDGSPVNAIVDMQKNVGGAPVSTIMPGESLTYTWALPVSSSGSHVQLEFSPTMMGTPAVVTGQT